jgi:hypothetical protein
LFDSTIPQNALTASSLGITVLGGGLFNGVADETTVSVANSVITQNSPDQCYGC